MNVGDYTLEDTVTIPFTSRAFATGIPTALTSGEVQIYEDTSTTQITAAETTTVSLDTVVGLNIVSIAATAANGFEAGKSYTAVLSAGTVGGVSVVGEVVGHFTIARSAAAADLANGTDGLTALKAYVASPTNITAGTITTVTNLTNAPTNGDLTATMKTSVNTEVVDALSVDTIADLSQGLPPATPTLEQAIMYLYSALRNKGIADKTAGEKQFFNDADVLIWKKAVTKTATAYTEAEGATGP